MNNSLKNKFTNKKYILIILIIFILFVYFHSGIDYLPVEELGIPSGIGNDLSDDEFSIPMAIYNYGSDKKITTFIYTGVSDTIAGTRQNRQLLFNKNFRLGHERIIISSEKLARFGIINWVSIVFKNPNINDTALIAVTKEETKEILNYNVPEYPSAADYIAQMIKNSTEFNFFSDNYKLMDIFVRLYAEGRNIVLPYIELENGKFKITGMALFKKDKMMKKIDINDSRIMNILRENKVKGILALKESSKKYISYYTITKRNVKCERKNGKYYFTIDIGLNGEIVENNMFKDIRRNKETMQRFETYMSKYVEKMCYNFIRKMQNDYKVDCLELGRVAAAKFGRHTGVDWDEIITDRNKTEIKVKVNVNVKKMGRGNY